MPELPEVETIVRGLAPRLIGRRILRAELSCPRVLRTDSKILARAIAGERISAVRRHGKFIVIQLETGGCLAIHLGMTGKLLLNSSAGPYTRAVFHLDGGSMLYDDIRQFGRIEWTQTLPDRIQKLGPDPLAITAADFAAVLRARRGMIKPLLLNQRFLRGLGNIYTDEALFRAGIHPRAIAARLGEKRASRLHAAITEVLLEAIERGGSSVSNYVGVGGRRGWFQVLHRVYGKTGEPCPTCSRPIRRIVVAQRGTHYCPHCQRL